MHIYQGELPTTHAYIKVRDGRPRIAPQAPSMFIYAVRYLLLVDTAADCYRLLGLWKGASLCPYRIEIVYL